MIHKIYFYECFENIFDEFLGINTNTLFILMIFRIEFWN